MKLFELEPKDISDLSDGDLRDLVGRLSEAEIRRCGLQPSSVLWGGAQEAPDGGLDVQVKNADRVEQPNFIPRAETGFQVKKNKMGPAACVKEMTTSGTLKPVIAELAKKNGAYIIVSGADDCSFEMLESRIKGMRSALDGVPNKNDLAVDFYGRDRLATWLRQHPGVSLWTRSVLGKPLCGWKPFGRWSSTPQGVEDQFLLDDHPCVFNFSSRSDDALTVLQGIELIRAKLRNSSNAVRITGLSGVGKTRFVQALFEPEVGSNSLPESEVIYADRGETLNPSESELISYLMANDYSAYLVLDNCPPEVHRQLLKLLSEKSHKLKLITIEYDIADDRPEETDVVHLEPSSEEIVSKLLQKRQPELGKVNADRIAEFSGGNARLAIALAAQVDADETLSNFKDEDLFNRLFSQRRIPSESLLANAETLSLVYSFDVADSKLGNELTVLAEIAETTRRALYRSQGDLLARGLCQKRGGWRAVLPHAFANRLAKRALERIPPDEINTVLLQSENCRLLKSCAHRLGYLHNFEPAEVLASSWFEAGGPLHDFSSLDADGLAILEFITPIDPERVLLAIEKQSQNSEFTSRQNRDFSTLVSLLRKLAYEDENFDRATEVILAFARTERPDENYDSITRQLESLFSLYLSGTLALPERRQAFLGRLLASNEKIDWSISKKLLSAAFETSHWSSSYSFDFGARKRSFGWAPKSRQDIDLWYNGFVNLLKPSLLSSEEGRRTDAAELLANNFGSLWSRAGCFDVLEQVIEDSTGENGNPPLWRAIKKTIASYSEPHCPETLRRLEELENLTAPNSLRSEIEAYALVYTWEQALIAEGNLSEQTKKVHDRVETLGESAAIDYDLLSELGPKLWREQIDALQSFGAGLAKGAHDPEVLFHHLVRLMQEQKLNHPEPILFHGFLKGVHEQNAGLCRKLQEAVLDIPELKPHFVYLLTSTPIEPWGTQLLIKHSKDPETPAGSLYPISAGGVHETLTDLDLIKIVDPIIKKRGGIEATIQLLGMRFFAIEKRKYVPSPEIRAFGRSTLNELAKSREKEINVQSMHSLDKIIGLCFSPETKTTEVEETIDLFIQAFSERRLYTFHFEDVIDAFIHAYPELVLNRIFQENQEDISLRYDLFRDRVGRHESALNSVPCKRLKSWCGGDDNRILEVLGALTVYVPQKTISKPKEGRSPVVIHPNALALLDAANDKGKVVDALYNRSRPTSYSGSLAQILEGRLRAFTELLKHPSPEVRDRVKSLIPAFEQSIAKNSRIEAERASREEQRFE
tara:strand:+ start:296 stop:4120 length:3825 start_codon:yes stop_codon:yes gene_type:complete